ncbi:MAG: hypothetical protein E6H43_08765 [Betaproteobacteria bacterium]|nr:MAG: hypothetical protein E6H43_08765 [Betaproteobacteria bacterium]
MVNVRPAASTVRCVHTFLGSRALGIFGAGHLGRAIAQGLIDAEFPRDKLVLCHRGTRLTSEAVARANLAALIVDPQELVRRSRLLLYLVRPQDYGAIANFTLREDCVLLSFLAGVSLSRLPVKLSDEQCVRVLTSGPDTLRSKMGIAAVYPANNVLASELVSALHLRMIALRRESEVHAFTALGPCLPIALTHWEGLGHDVNEAELIETAQKFELADASVLVKWARAVQPRGLPEAERLRYISEATTPGGVTEAILRGIDIGERLPVALEGGIRRSRELSVA